VCAECFLLESVQADLLIVVQGYEGESLWYRMYNSFGYLNTVGYGGHLFPVFIGEVGSKFKTATDITSLDDMRDFFLGNAGTGTTHNPVRPPLPPNFHHLCGNLFSMASDMRDLTPHKRF